MVRNTTEQRAVQGEPGGLAGAAELVQQLRGLPRERVATTTQRGAIACHLRPIDQPAGAAGRNEALPGPARFYSAAWVAAEPVAAPVAAPERRLLCLADQSLGWPVVPPGSVVWHLTADRSAVEGEPGALRLREALGPLAAPPELIVVALDGRAFPADALLDARLEPARRALGQLLELARTFLPQIEAGSVRLGALICHALDAQGRLLPVTGLFGGFVKSLARDLPNAHLLALHHEAGLAAALPDLSMLLAGPGPEGALAEYCIRTEGRFRPALLPNPRPVRADTSSPLAPGGVVLATGGARGVTAVVIEELMRSRHCRVIALGRTRIEDVPARYLEMTEAELAAEEASFYREAVRAEPGRSIIELKRRFRHYTAANEIMQTSRRLSAVGGSFEYLPVDITDPAALTQAVADVIARHGRIGAVIHGAGTQISKSLAGKTPEEFDSVVAAKLVGLRNLYQALTATQPDALPYFHLLTSAFSFWGNDGQPDYGAANEAMNRLAECMGPGWSTLAWLGWAGIGMTRGSEYASLAETRGLHPVGREEGQRIFGALFAAHPLHAVNILATERELRFYRVPVAESQPQLRREHSAIPPLPIEVTPERMPYLLDHRVDGIPTVPGAMELMLALQAARRVVGGAAPFEVRDARFVSFLRHYPDRPCPARVEIAVPPKGPLQLRVVSDFVHSSGRVLREGVVHFSATAARASTPIATAAEIRQVALAEPGFQILDPYVHGSHGVQLSGPFDCLRGITINAHGQVARFVLHSLPTDTAAARSLVPGLLLDALWRLAVMRPEGHRLPVYVPLRAEVIEFGFDEGAQELLHRLDGATLVVTRPLPGEQPGSVHVPHACAFDRQGTLLVANHGILAVENG